MTTIDPLRHWSALSRTDPKHTKSFQRAGGFRGTATRPIWTEYRLTEHFGPCGIGWGCDEPSFQIVPAGEEILVFCTVRGWYVDGTERGEVYGVGGDKVLIKQQSGLRADDEAYKKAFTDALGNAFKHVGSGADVHMGLFEDSKYVAAMQREFAEESPQAAPVPVGERSAPPASQAPATGTATPAPAAAGQAALPINRAAMPPTAEQPPAVTAARLRIKTLIDQYDHRIRTAPNKHALELVMDDGRDELAEIEAAGEAGKEAAGKLRGKFMTKMDQFEERAA